jgi:anti-sigma regulatory factor (Ser/Thr protein kinase)
LSRWAFDSGDARAARRAQTAYTDRLRAEGLVADRVAMAELAFVELLGNAARYAPGEVEVWLDWQAHPLRLHFVDHGKGFHYRSRLPSDPLSESGRGLYLLSKLTEDFYVSIVPGKGSHVCAVLLSNDRRPQDRRLFEVPVVLGSDSPVAVTG